MMTADSVYGPIGPAGEGLVPNPAGGPSATVDTRTSAPSRAQTAPAAGGRWEQWANDSTFWLMVVLFLAVVLASYAATGRLPSIDIDL